MLGRTPDSITAARPIIGGNIANFKLTEELLRIFIERAVGQQKWWRPRIVISVPVGLSEVEQRSFHESARAAGAREVVLIASSMAAALGSGLPVMEPIGSMVVDIGGGTSEIAVFSLGGAVCSTSIPIAGDQMDQLIAEYIQERHGLLIGDRAAAMLKHQIGSATKPRRPTVATVAGRDERSGVPKQIELHGDELQQVLAPAVDAITEAIRETLAATPPELAGDILDRGILLSGGGALLSGIDRKLRSITGLPCLRVEAPFESVAHGAGLALEHPEVLDRIAL